MCVVQINHRILLFMRRRDAPYDDDDDDDDEFRSMGVVRYFCTSAVLKLLRLVRTSGTSLALWRRDAPRGPYLPPDNDDDDDGDRTREH